ncbi:fatty acid desaturase family protein [Variovorax paradoxus]|uniref:fatty acid desaturase family protein n=1 Tax=Variovorax paradoxus TaxID=34073 RepID=UPI0009BE7E1E|nr:fatty acid desaturase [Variovorax paradoxus]
MSATPSRHPPRLPEHFLAPTRPVESLRFLCHALGLAFVPGLAAWVLVTCSGWSLFALVPAIALLSAIAGFGFYVVGTVAHEGFHFTLAESKWRSALLGVWFSSPVLAFLGVGFHLVHASHHRHTNAPEDPDLQLFSQFRSTWSRLLLLRLANNRVYMRVVLSLLLHNRLPEGMSSAFSLADLRRLSWVNLAAQAFWAGLYGAAFVVDPWLGLCTVVLPHAMTAFISAAIVFVQHGDTGDLPADNARTLSSPLATLLMGGTNFHLEHHLYPRVPCWRLQRVHRWLCGTAWAAQQPMQVERSFWRGMLLIRERHAYGSAEPGFRPHPRA